MLEEAVFEELKVFTQLAHEQESELIARLVENIGGTKNKIIAADKAKIRELKKRILVIDNNIKTLFEEKCLGTIPPNIFKQLMDEYSAERQAVENTVLQLEQKLSSYRETEDNVQKWVNLIKQHLNMKKLTRKAVVELIDHIDVCERKKVSNKWEQEITIIYRFIGTINKTQVVHEQSA
jgi:ketol-acid reductoisomerase